MPKFILLSQHILTESEKLENLLQGIFKTTITNSAATALQPTSLGFQRTFLPQLYTW